MTALIIVPPYASRIVDYYNLPMGLLYVASAVRKTHDVKILNLNEIPRENYERVIRYHATDATVMMTGGLSVHYNILKEIVDIVDRNTDIPIVLGGGIVSSQPELISTLFNADIFVTGEADEFEMIEDDFGIRSIDTVSTNKLDIAMPAYDLFNMESYLGLQRPSDSHYRAIVDNPREAAIIASRGCPYNCTFCFHPTGNKYRQRSLNSVFTEIEYLVEHYNINILAIYDECFATSKPRLTEFCERIRKYNLHWSCQLRVDSVDLDTMKMLKDSGCYIISFGIESASDRILKNYNKHITVAQINKALEWSKQVGIVVQGNIILGAEEETVETIKESLEWWKKHREYHFSIGPVIPYPGTEMYKNAVAAGKINPVKFLEDGCPAVNCCNVSFEMPSDITQELVPIFDVGYEDLLDFYGRVKLSFKTKCPYCGYEQTRSNYAMDMVGSGIKWCSNCHMRYFIKAN
jgi:radical SAM superfamily enzyme YgiQ (UPF0313 family)